MKLSKEDLYELHDLASQTAVKAGQLIRKYTHQPVEAQTKKEGSTPASQVVTEVDYKAEALIIECLTPSLKRFDLALLSEEKPDDHQRLIKDYFWCIDPLDGTLAFTESKPGYAVSIALVANDGIPIIGAIYDPLSQTLYSAQRGIGVFKNNEAWMLNNTIPNSSFTLPCDRSLRTQPDFDTLLNSIRTEALKLGVSDIELVHDQGAVINAITVLEKAPGLYFKRPKPQQGGGSLWDFAATTCIFNELDLIVCDFNGKPLKLNRSDTTFMNDEGVVFSTDKLLSDMIRNLK